MLIRLLKSVFPERTGKAPGDAETHYRAGLDAATSGRHTEALAFFERAIALDPANEDFHAQAALAHRRLGDDDGAWKRCEAALARDPNLTLARNLMAAIALPGPPYLEVLARIHRFLRPRTYLEIGVEHGGSLRLALPETRAVGIDPAPDLRFRLSARTTIRTTTSDEYFAGGNARADFGDLPVDLAFIDGMHHFEFGLRDFINVEKHCTRDSTVLIHDCYPLDRETAGRERKTEFWSGDTWRLFLALRRHRPDLRLHTVACVPTGLAVARNLDPGSRALEENYDAIVREHMALDYSVLEADKPGMLALYPNEWEKIEAILRG